MHMIWIRMPVQRQKCKEPWTKSHRHVITMISQSAQKRQRLYSNLHLEPTITVNGQKTELLINSPTWEALSRAVHTDDKVIGRIAKKKKKKKKKTATKNSVAFERLRANVWERNGVKLDTKLKVYKAVVLPTLLYACETWTVYQHHAKRLNHFHLSCLRKLLKSSGNTRFQTQRS